MHTNGADFFAWFQSIKRRDFINSVISPVRQRAGLGFPPERFTTNRSEQTNRSIQEFIKSEYKGNKKVDEFTFCVVLSKLVNQQKQAVEMAILGLGEYKLKDKFKHLEVSGQEWNGMEDEQKKKVLERLLKVSLDKAKSSTANISKVIRSKDNAILSKSFEAGVDWIPKEMLSSIVDKAITSINNDGAVSLHGNNTVVVESYSNPRKPHLEYPNGKTECDCSGFSSSSVCGHSVAACIKRNKVANFLKWLSSTKRNAGGIKISRAITFGIPKAGQGRNPLKQGSTTPEALRDLVVVSKMPRKWMNQGRIFSKTSNIYFHCSRGCILRKQSNFQLTACFIAPQIAPYILPRHREYIRVKLYFQH